MTRPTARKKAKALGHALSRFEAQHSHLRPATVLYYLAHCEICGAACFAEEIPVDGVVRNDYLSNPAVSRRCEKEATA